MTAVGLLHGIHGKKPDAVGHVPQVLVAGLGNCLDNGGWGGVSHNWKGAVSRDSTEGRGLALVSWLPKQGAIRREMFPLIVRPLAPAIPIPRNRIRSG